MEEATSKWQQRKARRLAEGKTAQCRSIGKRAVREDSPHAAVQKMQHVQRAEAKVEAERRQIEI